MDSLILQKKIFQKYKYKVEIKNELRSPFIDEVFETCLCQIDLLTLQKNSIYITKK